MSKGFSVAYERWTEADIEAGDTDDRGFVVRNASLRDAIHDGLEYSRPEWSGSFETDTGCSHNARWLTFYDWNDGTRDKIERGINEQRSLHIPEHVTIASRKRIVRLFQ